MLLGVVGLVGVEVGGYMYFYVLWFIIVLIGMFEVVGGGG